MLNALYTLEHKYLPAFIFNKKILKEPMGLKWLPSSFSALCVDFFDENVGKDKHPFVPKNFSAQTLRVNQIGNDMLLFYFIVLFYPYPEKLLLEQKGIVPPICPYAFLSFDKDGRQSQYYTIEFDSHPSTVDGSHYWLCCWKCDDAGNFAHLNFGPIAKDFDVQSRQVMDMLRGYYS